jgi:nicotinamidase/pyrazinamidase
MTESQRHHRPALIVVDVQRDFCQGGALPVPQSDRVVPAINRYLAEAGHTKMPVYASRDWHPPVTTHFAAYGGTWPPHCVRGTDGAQFHPHLRLPTHAIVLSKGEEADRHGYSACDGRTARGTSFLDDVRDRHVNHLYVTGLATEYCVKQTVLDARRAGLRVTVLTDAIAGLEARAGDVDRALTDMAEAGAEFAEAMTDATLS